MNIFKKTKTPEQLVRMAKESLAGGPAAAAGKELGKRLTLMKAVLYGEADKEAVPAKCIELSQAIIQTELMVDLIDAIPTLEFEPRKDVAQIFNNLMRKNVGQFNAYMFERPHLMGALMRGYDAPESALSCGSMLRECLRQEPLCREFLYGTDFWLFFDRYVHLPNFDIASDAFHTFKDSLTLHPALSARFLDEKFDEVFTKYECLLSSENYVTRRQSLKLLGELLLDKDNFAVMMRYISKKQNLKSMMQLLRDPSPNIQFEAFHVFKVFVANPKKPADVHQILFNNKDKLLAYLRNFQNDKEDEQFADEKQLLINTLANMQRPAPVEQQQQQQQQQG